MADVSDTLSQSDAHQGAASRAKPNTPLGLIELEQLHARIDAEICEACDGPDDLLNPIMDRWYKCLGMVIATPAVTAAEIAAKARVIRFDIGADCAEEMMASLCADLERLAPHI